MNGKKIPFPSGGSAERRTGLGSALTTIASLARQIQIDAGVILAGQYFDDDEDSKLVDFTCRAVMKEHVAELQRLLGRRLSEDELVKIARKGKL